MLWDSNVYFLLQNWLFFIFWKKVIYGTYAHHLQIKRRFFSTSHIWWLTFESPTWEQSERGCCSRTIQKWVAFGNLQSSGTWVLALFYCLSYKWLSSFSHQKIAATSNAMSHDWIWSLFSKGFWAQFCNFWLWFSV